MTHNLFLNHSISHKPSARRYGEKGRDPYDGLRVWSAVTHGIGAALALLETGVLLALSSLRGGRFPVAMLIYGLSMILLYSASTLYHAVNGSVSRRMALRRFDHASIYLLIAGSYTPVCLLVLPENWGTPLLTALWLVAAFGIALCIAWITAPRWLTAGLYLLMGWLGAIALRPLLQSFSSAGFFWLMTGAVLYTIGGILYALKLPGRNRPKFGCHEIFHIFVLLGSTAHFFMMLTMF